ncbi:TRAP transporter permease [Desulfofundulus salinus]|uniref:TRAP transporter permease n=1 Tax=Desulfofundulus salinus TaxID=2419843 RepID=A0A494WRH7_9FIRM|nr:TRAP transporter permease [Desulfofundulus salinum]RKO65839.1 TRAP transporter permease [Desulfofundulus salinum]
MASPNTKEISLARDREAGGSTRKLSGWQKTIVAVIAILFSLFEIIANSLINMEEIYRNAISLAFMVTLAILLYPATRKSSQHRLSHWDALLAMVGAASVLYIVLFYTDLHVMRKSQAIMTDYIFAALTIVILLEVSRRVVGWFIPALCVLFLIYALYARYFPGMFAMAGFSLERLLFRMYMTTDGIFGMTLSIASTYIFIFILFGAFLRATGAASFFNDLAMALAGRWQGGPAQVAVISSAMMGSLNGSAVSNVATTGTFTIPLMKRVGYEPHFAGAVEAVSSTGGMIMPPIMGAAAFIMAGFLGIPYSTVILAAIVPALLYYASVIISVYLEARRLNLKGLDPSTLPRTSKILRERGVLLIPILVIFVTLLTGKTPLYAGFLGILTTIAASFFVPGCRLTLTKFLTALEEGATGILQVGIACASVGIIVGVVNMTGVGSVFAYNIINLSQGSILLALILVLLTSILLSMGLPSTALYIVVAVTAAPALVKAGVLPLAAHFFVFWFGAISNITPPVALASYTAAGIAESDPMRTGWAAFRLAIPGFLIPFLAAYNPILLMQTPPGESFSVPAMLLAVVTGLVGVSGLSVATINFLKGYLSLPERLLFFVGSTLLIIPGLVTDSIGMGILAIALALHFARASKEPHKAAVP